ncbi:MAG TPA: hypothetical protein VMN57_00470 [Anaerolineales bacterium]|nr:hypothetical protein [Anaerolineales bacterium]
MSIHRKTARRRKPPALAVILLALASLACLSGGSGDEVDPRQATADALSQSIQQTVAAEQDPPTDAPVDNSAIATAQARATEQTIAAQQTSTAVAGMSGADMEATRQAFGPILDTLPTYGVDPNAGRPAWIHPPVTIDIEGYLVADYANNYIGTVVTDFVVSSDITWNTQFGTAGCGFALRSNGNEEAFDQYFVIATRGGNGRVEFALQAGGEILNTKDFYAYGLDGNFDWRNDTTNRLTIVMRGPLVWIYTNDTLIAEFDVNDPPQQPYIPPAPAPPADVETNPEAAAAYEIARAEYDATVTQINAEFRSRQQAFVETDVEFEKGFVAMLAVNESGYTTCTFDNTWLFLIEE